MLYRDVYSPNALLACLQGDKQETRPDGQQDESLTEICHAFFSSASYQHVARDTLQLQ